VTPAYRRQMLSGALALRWRVTELLQGTHPTRARVQKLQNVKAALDQVIRDLGARQVWRGVWSIPNSKEDV
jgi:hypothetical protein